MAPVKILIVDDDRDDIDLFTDAISELDASICCVSTNNGFDALKLLESDETSVPDYIFLDLNMPRMNGKVCLKEIKSITRVHDIPVVIYTTSRHSKEVEEVKSLGAAYFLTKPTRFHDLQDALACILAHRAPEDELMDTILTEF
jgi:CheY-like chemotaxis protein